MSEPPNFQPKRNISTQGPNNISPSRLDQTLACLLVMILCLFSLTTLIYWFWPPINKLLGLVIVPVFFTLYFRLHRWYDLFFAGLLMIISCLSTIHAIDLFTHLHDAFYYCFTLAFLWKITDRRFIDLLKYALQKTILWLRIIVSVDLLLITGGLFLKQTYLPVWGGYYYACFAFSSNTFAAGTCLVTVFLLFLIKDIPSFWLRILPMLPISFAIMQSGSRIFIPILFIHWVFFYRYRFAKFQHRSVFLLIIFLGLIILLLTTRMLDKILFTTLHNVTLKPMTAFTSGRSVFWLIDLNSFKETTVFQKIFGQGFDRVYFINETQCAMRINAHNDFINALLGGGLAGLVTYIAGFMAPILRAFREGSRLDAIIFFLYLFLPAFWNDLFMYQHFLFSGVILYVLFEIEGLSKAKGPALCQPS